MTRSSIIRATLVIFVLIVLGIIGGYFYLSNTRTTIDPEMTGVEGDLGPEGEFVFDGGTTTPNIGTAANPLEGDVPRLRKISATPVSGSTIFNRRVGTTTYSIIRFVDRATGNIYETSTSSLNTIRITNTTIPKVQDAMFSADGNSVVMRYANDADFIQTFVGRVTATSSELVGTFISENAISPTLSPTKTRFFYLLPNTNTNVNGGVGSIGYVSDFTPRATNIFSHPLRRWAVNWPNENTLVLTNSPTSVSQSSTYTLSTRGGSLNKVLGPKNGLVVLPSPSVGNLMFSETINNTLITGFKRVGENIENNIAEPTIPDKCVWALGDTAVFCGTPKFVALGQYPDVWYQGLVSFNDRITVTDPTSLQTTSVIDPIEAVGEEIDATDLQISSDGKYLIFTNKKDLSLWGLRL
jgi:hypothetical protein